MVRPILDSRKQDMRLLVLGGTQFLGRAITTHAVGLGNAVTCAARGVSRSPPPGTRFVTVDRDRPDGLAALKGDTFDAAVDVSRAPSQVRRALAALDGRIGHWTFVSTTSVYADTRTPGQRADTAPLLAPADGGPYGAAKAACERAFGGSALIARAGLIVGPGDPTGRFIWRARAFRASLASAVSAWPSAPIAGSTTIIATGRSCAASSATVSTGWAGRCPTCSPTWMATTTSASIRRTRSGSRRGRKGASRWWAMRDTACRRSPAWAARWRSSARRGWRRPCAVIRTTTRRRFRDYEDGLRPFVDEVQNRAATDGMSMLFPADEAELAERDRRLTEGDIGL
ncbi:hypothetical protein [Methylobacterium terrae]|uniref:hypothetical protein n=1 Tax=Methylobacterium terrae TaxID=2202827 RepID=UPI0013A549FE|nr:hypothetical protein [Methylobacterium terrae]